MIAVIRSGQFRRDVKGAEKRGKDMAKLRQVLLLLLEGEALPERYKDHPLRGNWTAAAISTSSPIGC